MKMKEQTSQTLKGILTDEFQSKKDIFKVATSMDIKPIEVNKMLKEMSKDGEVTIKETKTGVLVKLGTETPSSEKGLFSVKDNEENKGLFSIKKQEDFGTEVCYDKDGNEYIYRRNEFDGFKVELDELHEEMKKALMNNSAKLIDSINGFCGANRYAMTIINPKMSKRKDGKVFYRWTGQHTESMMDQLWAFIKENKLIDFNLIEEVEALKEEGE